MGNWFDIIPKLRQLNPLPSQGVLYMASIADFIDLDRYPLDNLDSPSGRILVKDCRQMMREHAICALKGFLRPAIVRTLSNEVTSLEDAMRRVDFQATPYGWLKNSGFPENHPRSRLFHRRCGVLTADQLKPKGPCTQLFQFAELTEFVRRLLGYESLFNSACPNISVRLNIMQQGDEFGWHYDTNDGAVSLVLQDAQEGGAFEYAPLIRSEEDENYDRVSRIFSGRTSPVVADAPAGTFILFMGRRSLHRVASVGQTQQSRQTLLFSYDRKPGMVFPEKIRKRLLEPSPEPFVGQ